MFFFQYFRTNWSTSTWNLFRSLFIWVNRLNIAITLIGTIVTIDNNVETATGISHALIKSPDETVVIWVDTFVTDCVVIFLLIFTDVVTDASVIVVDGSVSVLVDAGGIPVVVKAQSTVVVLCPWSNKKMSLYMFTYVCIRSYANCDRERLLDGGGCWCSRSA